MTSITERGSGSRRRKIMLAVVLALLAFPAAATAASAPSVLTGSAQQIAPTSATLTGTVDPNAQDTSYFFQFGPSRSYGVETTVTDAGAGSAAVHVSVPIASLTPGTTYHYRLIAVNASGASTGSDATLTTAKIPLSLQLASSLNPVPFGAPVVIRGVLAGTGAGGQAIVLQANPFPYLQGFVQVGNPELTNPDGSFAFPVLEMTQGTQFRVTTMASPQISSPVLLQGVAVRVGARVQPLGRHLARFFGTVTPPENGMQIVIVRLGRLRNVAVAETFLRPLPHGGSHFSRVVRVNPGLYIVLARVSDGSHSPGYSAPLRIG